MNQEMNNEQRYSFRQDENGHWYLIPAIDTHTFDRLLPIISQGEETEEEAEIWEAVIEPCRINGGIEDYTFVNPERAF